MDGWNNGPQMPPFYGQQGNVQYTYAPVKKKKVWLWIVSAVVLVAAVIAAVVIFVLPGGESPSAFYRMPVFYSKNGDFYMMAGTKAIELEDAQPLDSSYSDINGMMDEKANYFYYLADADDGEGDMMRLKLGGSVSQPVECATGVCYAICSKDGSKVLYLKDMDDSEGELYLYPGDKIDDSVIEGKFGFSKNGGAFYYVTSNKKDGYTLYIQKGAFEPAEVAETEDEKFSNIIAADDGTAAYTLSDGSDKEVWRWDGTEAEKLDEGELLTTVDSSRLFYIKDGSLYFWSKSGGKEKVCSDYYSLYFATPSSYNSDPRRSVEDRALVIKEDGPGYTLLEYKLGGTTEKIADADLGAAYINSGFSMVCYSNEDGACLAKKTGSGWEAVEFEEDLMFAWFGFSGDSLYYITPDRELIKVSLATEEEESIFEDIIGARDTGQNLYVIDSDRNMYIVRPNGKSERVARDVYGATETYGGALYVLIDEEGEYIGKYFPVGSSKGESVFEGADYLVFPQDYIDWVP